jgi:uncharacterized protein
MSDGLPIPRFRTLAVPECEAILERNHVGRIAYERRNRVEIIPIHYVFANGVVNGRTAPGTRLEELGQGFYGSWPVAFQVDEIEGLFQWRSVVVHGSFQAAMEGDPEWRRIPQVWEEAVRQVRTLMPEAFTEEDPTRFWCVLVRIHIAEWAGREAVSE